MKYLIITEEKRVFLTYWFDKENLFMPGMVVIDTETRKFTIDGETWNDIEEDHL